MTTDERTTVSVLGLGEMGRALADRLLTSGHPTTVWNRSAGRADSLVASGAFEASSVHDAATAGPLSIVYVRDYASARGLLERETSALLGRSIVNLTTGTPAQARAMAAWAAEHDIGYLDGAIMATPPMVKDAAATLLYSGTSRVYAAHRSALEVFGSGRYLGEDDGMASLQDLALLGAMYSMIAGSLQAFAMVGSAGVNAEDFADTLGSWLRAMTASIPDMGRMTDSRSYATDVQDLRFTKAAVDTIIEASADERIGAAVLREIATVIDRQIDDGHGHDHFTRMIESMRAV